MAYDGEMRTDHDPEIARLETELHESRSQIWDVEKYLIERHQKKIADLSKPQHKWRSRLTVAKEIIDYLFLTFGRFCAIVMMTVWLLTGSVFPPY